MTSPVVPFVAREMELCSVRGDSLLAYPRGRHEQLRQTPPRVTVCVPVHEGADRMQRALASLASQSQRDLAVVILDNNSRDGSFRIGCQFARQNENFIVYQNPRNIGRIGNWNRCLDLAVGEYVKLLSVNDALEPSFLARLVATMDEDAELSVACATARVLREGAGVAMPYFPSSRAMTGASALVHALGAGNLSGPTSTQLWRRKPIIDHRLRFRADLGWAAGFELAMQLLRFGDFAFVHDALALVDEQVPRHHNQASARSCFHEEVQARLSVLRCVGLPLPPRTLGRALGRVQELYEAFRDRADEEGQDRELDCDYAAAVVELGDLLMRAAHGRLGTPEQDGAEIRALLAEAEREARAAHYSAAEKQLRHILSLAPYNLTALKDLGVVRYRQADIWGARKYLLSALHIDPGFDLVRMNLDRLVA